MTKIVRFPTKHISVSNTARILDEVVGYARLFSQNIKHVFTRKTIRVSAMTGTAATDIGGQTAAYEFQYMKKKEHALPQDIEDFADTRINIIDEISFADYDKVLGKISCNLQNFTQCRNWLYGKTAICFLGDFCQLEAIGGNCIYKHRNGLYFEQELNCMVELENGHRFKCEIMKKLMKDIRDTGLSEENRKLLNTRVIDGVNVKMPNPETTRFATFYNGKRCKINAEVFQNYLKTYHNSSTETNICTSAIIIRATALWGISKKPLTFDQRKILFEECPENLIRNSSNTCDPLLCLFDGSNVMLNANDDVEHGLANGTTAIFRRAHLKPNARIYPIQMHGYWVNSVTAEDVEYLQLDWQDSRFKGWFRIKCKKATYTVKNYPVFEANEWVKMQMQMTLTQFPIVINHATTGHKLQGKSMDALVVAQWSNTKNWPLVVLSRVRELSGLFFMEPIPDDIDATPACEYLDMMENLRNTILASPEQIADLIKTLALN